MIIICIGAMYRLLANFFCAAVQVCNDCITQRGFRQPCFGKICLGAADSFLYGFIFVQRCAEILLHGGKQRRISVQKTKRCPTRIYLLGYGGYRRFDFGNGGFYCIAVNRLLSRALSGGIRHGFYFLRQIVQTGFLTRGGCRNRHAQRV